MSASFDIIPRLLKLLRISLACDISAAEAKIFCSWLWHRKKCCWDWKIDKRIYCSSWSCFLRIYIIIISCHLNFGFDKYHTFITNSSQNRELYNKTFFSKINIIQYSDGCKIELELSSQKVGSSLLYLCPIWWFFNLFKPLWRVPLNYQISNKFLNSN